MKKTKDAVKRQLKEQWKQACNGYIVELLRMWELDAHYGYWIGDETCAIICAMLLVWGNTAEFTHNHRLVCELQYAQKRFGIDGGSVPNDRKFLTAFNYYTDLLTLNQQREDRVPDHIDAMFQERYGYHFNRD